MPNNNKLTAKQLAFIDAFIETHNATESAKRAGYSLRTSDVQGSRLLKDIRVAEEIRKRQEEAKKASIATAQQVMEYFTKVMNGEIKDQFGLETPISERTRAAQELAKRTVDLENRLAGKADGVLEIKINWED